MTTPSVSSQPPSRSLNLLNPDEDDSLSASSKKSERKSRIQEARQEISGHLDSIPVSWQQADPVGPAASFLQKGIQKAREIFTSKIDDPSIKDRNRWIEESMKAHSSQYEKGYPYETLVKNQKVSPLDPLQENASFVFLKEKEKLIFGGTKERFIFGGTSDHSFLPSENLPLSSKNSVVCEDSVIGKLTIIDDRSGLVLSESSISVNTTIAGTTDERVCKQFKTHLLRGAAYSLVKEPPSPEARAPYSDTPVFDCSEGACEQIFNCSADVCEQTGDLMVLPDFARKKILSGDFTACDYFSTEITRLSLYPTNVGAIVVGTTDPNVCESLRLQRSEEIQKLHREIFKFLTETDRTL